MRHVRVTVWIDIFQSLHQTIETPTR